MKLCELTWKRHEYFHDPEVRSEQEYAALVHAVISTAKSEIKPHARYARLPLTLDHSIDRMQTRLEWQNSVCERHRASWHEKLRNAGLMK